MLEWIQSDAFLYSQAKFLWEILAAEWIFVYWLPKKSHWTSRLSLTFALLFFVAYFWSPTSGGLTEMIKYFLLFSLSVAGISFVFKCSPQEALYRGAAAYATQHIANSIASLIMFYLPGLWFLFFSNHSLNDFPLGGGTDSHAALFTSTCHLPVYLAAYIGVYLLIHLLFGKHMKKEGLYGVDNRFLVFFIVIMMILVVVLNYCVAYFVPMENNILAHVLFSFYAIIGCIFSLFIQTGLHQQSRLAQSLEITRQLIHNQEKHRRISEETINTINLKCHDLKHQVAALRRNIHDPNSQSALKEIESAVLIYDAVAKTGNPVLDTILTEKSLYCENHQIQLTYMADGTRLSFISDTDLYAMLGNLLDNAIESVLELDEPEKRSIGLTISMAGNMLIIHTENYYHHPVKMENGLPVTTKKDTHYHGFGMKSLQLLATRYGGTLAVDADDEIFNVNIMLPLPPV